MLTEYRDCIIWITKSVVQARQCETQDSAALTFPWKYNTRTQRTYQTEITVDNGEITLKDYICIISK